jgi:hypothetical protein
LNILNTLTAQHLKEMMDLYEDGYEQSYSNETKREEALAET